MSSQQQLWPGARDTCSLIWGGDYKMFCRIASTVLIVLACTSARAADPADAWNWSGFYLGAHVGVAALDTEFRSDFGLIQPDTYNATPKSGGIHVGYGREFGSFYLGIEADVGAYEDTQVADFSTLASGGAGGSAVGGVVGGAVVGSVIGGEVGGSAVGSAVAGSPGYGTTLLGH